MSVAIIRLRPMRAGDLPLLHQWLNQPHVLSWWGGQPFTLAQVRAHYHSSTLARSKTTAYIGLLDDLPFAYAQSYVAMGAGGGWWPNETDPGVRGIDQFIALAEYLGQGLGFPLVRAVVDTVFADSAVSRIQVDPAPDNQRAIRCYEKAGFQRIKVIQTPDGPAVYMLRERDIHLTVIP